MKKEILLINCCGKAADTGGTGRHDTSFELVVGDAISALLLLRNKAIKPSSPPPDPDPGRAQPQSHRCPHHALRFAVQGVFHELGIAA